MIDAIDRGLIAADAALKTLGGSARAHRRPPTATAAADLSASERRLSDREGFLGDLLASHPPLSQRVIRLRGMAFQQEKRAAAEIA